MLGHQQIEMEQNNGQQEAGPGGVGSIQNNHQGAAGGVAAAGLTSGVARPRNRRHSPQQVEAMEV